MDPAFELALTSFVVTIGVGAWFFPIERYRQFGKIGAAGGILFFGSIVLLTHFKWTDIALEVSGARLQLTQAEERIAALTSQLAATTTQFASFEQEGLPSIQNARITSISQSILDQLSNDAGSLEIKAIKDAVSTGFRDANVIPIDDDIFSDLLSTPELQRWLSEYQVENPSQNGSFVIEAPLGAFPGSYWTTTPQAPSTGN